jgi:DNA-binding MarR family transcriptional regulator
MYFGHNVTLKENAARRERQDLVRLSREMEARHQQVLRLTETAREKLKASLPEQSPAL